MRSIIRSIAAFCLLLVLLVIVFVWGTFYILYLYPTIIFSLGALLMSIWFIGKFIANRRVIVGEDEAAIVEQWGSPYNTLYYGEHSLPIGARVRARYALSMGPIEGNEEEVHNCECERLRIRSQFNIHISDPYLFHYRSRKKSPDVTSTNRMALSEVVRELNQDDLWNWPGRVNYLVAQGLNRRLRDFGIQVTDYSLEEVTWSMTNSKWRRNRSYLAIRGGEPYWRGDMDIDLSYG
jgi:hypothetical protein